MKRGVRDVNLGRGRGWHALWGLVGGDEGGRRGERRTVCEARGDEEARDEEGVCALEVCGGESAEGVCHVGGGLVAAVEGVGPRGRGEGVVWGEDERLVEGEGCAGGVSVHSLSMAGGATRRKEGGLDLQVQCAPHEREVGIPLS